MLCLRNSKKDKIAGTESKREVEGDTMAEMAKGHMRRTLVNSEDFGFGRMGSHWGLG